MIVVSKLRVLDRDPYQDRRVKLVDFFHPGENRVFLRLPKLDPVVTADGQTVMGFLLRTAIDACFIVANNSPGFLSLSRDPTDTDSICAYSPQRPADILLEERCYYHLNNGERHYPICTDFHAWVPPATCATLISEDDIASHCPLPPHWVQLIPPGFSDGFRTVASPGSDRTVALKMQDASCLVTHHTYSLQVAHLVPRAEHEWVSQPWKMLST